MTRVIINDNNTNRTAPQQPRHRCPEGLEAYKAVPRPVAPPRRETVDPLEELCNLSAILNTSEGQKLGKSPLDFLREHLPDFCRATKMFDTHDCLPRTEVAADFHKACDNVPNVLVIIKSGQYIAGGFTPVSFESPEDWFYKPDPSMKTFLFSTNRQKVYPLKERERAIICSNSSGPEFGKYGLSVRDDYANNKSSEEIKLVGSSFYEPNALYGELLGGNVYGFFVSQYEVWSLQ